MASTYNNAINAIVNINPGYDGTQNKLLAVDTNNLIKYRNSTTIGITSNQSLNTTDNVTFSQVTTPTIISSSNIMELLGPNVKVYSVNTTVIGNTAVNLLTIPTVSNTNYLVFVEASAKDVPLGVGAASFIYTKRVTNITGILTNAQLQGASNVTALNNETLTITTLGTNILVQCAGSATSPGTYWTAYARVISAP